jgi:hypothetical protein
VPTLWRIRSIQRLEVSQVCNVGSAAECVHFVSYTVAKVSALHAVADPILDFSERGASGNKVGLLRLVQVLCESFGLISADRRNGVAEVARKAEISSCRSPFGSVLNDQLSELISEPPTI